MLADDDGGVDDGVDDDRDAVLVVVEDKLSANSTRGLSLILGDFNFGVGPHLFLFLAGSGDGEKSGVDKIGMFAALSFKGDVKENVVAVAGIVNGDTLLLVSLELISLFVMIAGGA